jgi:hypothetical protein
MVSYRQKGNIVKQTKFILFVLILFLVQVMAENNSTKYTDSNQTLALDTLSRVDINQSVVKVTIPPRKSLLEIEAEARAIIAEEVAKVEIVKANALAVIARAVASVEIAKIREEQQKESNSDLF